MERVVLGKPFAKALAQEVDGAKDDGLAASVLLQTSARSCSSAAGALASSKGRRPIPRDSEAAT
jgi:hypothetical protein